MDISGKGDFLVAEAVQVGTLIYRSPRPTEFEDLIVKPGYPVSVDEAWLKVAHFHRDVQAGKVSLRRVDVIPLPTPLEVAPEYDSQLDAAQKHLAVTICTMPLVEGEVSEQFKAAIHIGELLSDSGLPKTRNVKVTADYMTSHHLPFLQALLELEGRFQKRKIVVREVKKAIARIQELR